MTYDPVSGLYIQTFPPEHHEFLQKYGLRIEVLEHPEPWHSGWAHDEDNHSSAQAQLPWPGFHYHPSDTSVDSSKVAIPSPVSDYEAISMLKYIASPPIAAAQPSKHVA